MALIFLGVLIVLTVSSFESHKVELPMMSGPQIHQTSIHLIIMLFHVLPISVNKDVYYLVWGNVGVLSQAVIKAKISS